MKDDKDNLDQQKSVGGTPDDSRASETARTKRGAGFVKLIDIHDQAGRLHLALEKYLNAHSIPFRLQCFTSDGFVRYRVREEDLGQASAGPPALRELAKRKP